MGTAGFGRSLFLRSFGLKQPNRDREQPDDRPRERERLGKAHYRFRESETSMPGICGSRTLVEGALTTASSY